MAGRPNECLWYMLGYGLMCCGDCDKFEGRDWPGSIFISFCPSVFISFDDIPCEKLWIRTGTFARKYRSLHVSKHQGWPNPSPVPPWHVDLEGVSHLQRMLKASNQNCQDCMGSLAEWNCNEIWLAGFFKFEGKLLTCKDNAGNVASFFQLGYWPQMHLNCYSVAHSASSSKVVVYSLNLTDCVL